MTKDGKQKEPKVFGVYNSEGELVRLVEAHKVIQVKTHILGNITIKVASALTVARADVKVEKAE